MSTTGTAPESHRDELGFDLHNLASHLVGRVRVALGVGGAAAIILGVLLLVWPGRTLTLLAVFLGIYFIVSGLTRIFVGIFVHGLSGGLRTLEILLGLLLVIGGTIVLRDSQASAAVLLILAVTVIGISWIIEGVLALVESGRSGSQGWAIFYGIVSILAGIAVISVPGWSALYLVIFSGIVLIVLGIVALVRAITLGRGVRKAAAAAAAL